MLSVSTADLPLHTPPSPTDERDEEKLVCEIEILSDSDEKEDETLMRLHGRAEGLYSIYLPTCLLLEINMISVGKFDTWRAMGFSLIIDI